MNFAFTIALLINTCLTIINNLQANFFQHLSKVFVSVITDEKSLFIGSLGVAFV